MKKKVCETCKSEISGVPNLLCGHFICPECYTKEKILQTNAVCPFCKAKLIRRCR